VPIDLTTALKLHDRQSDYLTNLRASVAEVEGYNKGALMVLDARFLVRAPDDKPSEVIDAKIAAAEYPYGVASAAEWERVQSIVRNQEPGAFLTAIDPGVTDETVDQRDLEDRATNRDR
jgi:hypothetical protein